MMTVEAKQREGDTVWSSLTTGKVLSESEERKKLKEVQKHHLKDLLKKPNVTAVDIDYKTRKGEKGDQLAIVIWVRKKKPESQLNKDEIFPKNLDGCVVDVVENEATSCGCSCIESSEKVEQVCRYNNE
jgi:hypothetical protein